MYGGSVYHHSMYPSTMPGQSLDQSKNMMGGSGAAQGTSGIDSKKDDSLVAQGDQNQTGRRKGSKQSELNDMVSNKNHQVSKLFWLLQTNKGNDINAAMKYRAAKERPKVVEVWISKIHRNGLFAC